MLQSRDFILKMTTLILGFTIVLMPVLIALTAMGVQYFRERRKL